MVYLEREKRIQATLKPGPAVGVPGVATGADAAGVKPDGVAGPYFGGALPGK